MICASCGSENGPARKFCGGCAAPLATICPACGTPNEPGARFCGECARPLVPAATPGTPGGSDVPAVGTGPVAERRLVSVLFADLVGFTTFAEGRDAEDVRDVLGRYFDASRDVILRHGGSIEKFIGDAVVAVWGAPVAGEGDAERAVRAALELVDAVGVAIPGVGVRAAVMTGEAAVTLGVVGQGMVAGDLVNTASRLQAVAEPGTVLVGEATRRAASAAIAFEAVGPQQLKGKASPVAAWRAVRVVAEVGGRNRGPGLEGPFVGRMEELRLLKEQLHATTRDGHARLVSIVGPTGIGKTRLAAEFERYVDGLVEQVWWHSGTSPAHGDGVTCWALGEMVRRRCGVRETDDEKTTLGRLADTLAQVIVDETERRWVEPALRVLLGVENGHVGADRMFSAWRTFFDRMAASGTVVLLFEDLQHADSGLLDFIDHLLDWSRNLPILVITLARPEVLDRRPDWGAGKRAFTSVYLEPLEPPAMRDLLSGLVPGLPEPVVRSIVERAEGVPLYAVEMVRMLLMDGRVVAVDGACRVAGDLGRIAVPETLTELIATRLDALERTDRALLLDAAVIGQSFTVESLAAVSGYDEDAVASHLRVLVRRELLTVRVDPVSPGLGQHAFVQALIREVAYNTVARRDRKVKHLAAASYFESLGNDELAAAIAAHYVAAYRNAGDGPDAAAIAGQARGALDTAARRAAALGSHEQAVALLEGAIELTSDPLDQAALLLRAGRSASHASRHTQAEAFMRRAAGLHREAGDRRGLAEATAATGWALLQEYREPAALEVLEPVAGELADLIDEPEGGALYGQLARTYFLLDRLDRAIEICDRILPSLERRDLVELVADTLITKGSALDGLGRGYEGAGLVRAGLDLALAHGFDWLVLRARQNLASSFSELGLHEAGEWARGTLEMSERLGRRDMVLVYNASFVALHAGEWDWVEERIRAASELDDLELEDRAFVVTIAAWLAAWRGEDTAPLEAELDALAARAPGSGMLSVLRSENRLFHSFASGTPSEIHAAAVVAARQAIPLERHYTGYALRAAIWGRDLDEARTSQAACERLGGHGVEMAYVHEAARAGVAALEGRTGEALASYQRVLAGWRERDRPFDEALTAIDMASALDPALPEVQSAAARAREVLTRLRARPFLDRLDAALMRYGPPAEMTSRPAVPV